MNKLTNIKHINSTNHIVLTTMFALIFLLGVGIVSAQERPQRQDFDRPDSVRSTTTRGDIKPELSGQQTFEERTVQKEERIETIQEEASERKAILEEKRKERIKAYADRIVNRMYAAIERFSKIADRIESRMVKIEERFGEDIDLSESRDLLETARLEMAQAASSTDAVVNQIEEALNSETPREAYVRVRELFTNAKESIRNAHGALVDAIKSVRVAIGLNIEGPENQSSGGENATSTATTTEENDSEN